MKLCKYCNEYYPESDFGVAGTIGKKVYRRLKCRYCFNNDKQLLKQRYKKILDDYKIEHGCFKCGIKDFKVLEFHHLKDKDFTIGYASYNHLGIERIKKELKKCVVVCANCHRIIHYKDWRHFNHGV